jgi:hypothetical protein
MRNVNLEFAVFNVRAIPQRIGLVVRLDGVLKYVMCHFLCDDMPLATLFSSVKLCVQKYSSKYRLPW